MNTRQILILLSLLVISVGCSSRMKPTIALPEIPALESRGRVVGNDKSAHQLFVEKFTDARANSVIVKRGEEEVTTSGEISGLVELSLLKGLQARGFEVSATAPVVISGEVRIWQATITKAFPANKMEAKAEVFIEVLDPANKRIYSGTYKGLASLEDPSLNELEMRTTLGTAMSEALNQVVGDKQLLDLLMSF